MEKPPGQRNLPTEKTGRRREERNQNNQPSTEEKKERESHIGGGYFRNFSLEIPQRPTQEQEQANGNETPRDNETNRDAESTTSNNSEDAVATHETGAYPAIPVEDYRNLPIEEIAVHCLIMNRVVEE